MNAVETVECDYSQKKPNITKKVFNLGDNYKMYVAAKVVTGKGRSANSYSFEALHIIR
jgi:hypothetical protein